MINPAEKGSPAVFLDRDGVINRRRDDHVKSWGEFEFLPGVLSSLSKLRQVRARVVVITNQAAVGRGLLSAEDLATIHQRMADAVRVAGGQIERVYACPHRPQAGCACRKPGTELFVRASHELGIDLQNSVMIGDADTDVQAASAAGCLPVRISADGSEAGGTAAFVARDLPEAVSRLTSDRILH